ncbi:glutathione S-transferase 1-like [Drosophila innubila]|uniref:glutathione S-transferase 1-like n=1 Tax=Drosophila innubila TaxID=198719 RepID=UPI00148C5510|nr:glutathione S-transferase 1-like [Drosophila innubila]
MGKLTLYGFDASPPVRAVKLTLAALQVPFEYVIVNPLKKEQLSEEYLKKNPQHTIPLLEDDGKCIWDSHAIICYLASKYGKDDTMYPKDFYRRGIVDQRLHYDSSTMFTGTLLSITKPLIFSGVTSIVKSKIDAVAEVYDLVEIFLGDNDYIAGTELTIADFSFVTTMCCLKIFLEPQPNKYPKIVAWLERLKKLPYYEEANGNGAAQLETLLKSKNFTIESN